MFNKAFFPAKKKKEANENTFHQKHVLLSYDRMLLEIQMTQALALSQAVQQCADTKAD